MAAGPRVPARLRMGGLRARAMRLLARARASRLGRAVTRFGERGGTVLAGGVAYAAVFSLFATLTIAFTVGLALLGRDAALREAFLEQLAAWLPGLVGEGGLLDPEDLRLTVGPGVAGVVAAGALVWSASAFMGALGAGLRAMLDESTPRGRPVPPVVRTWLGFLGVGLGLVLSTVLSVGVTRIAALAGQGAVRGAGMLLALLVDTALVAFVLRVVAGVRPPRRDLLLGSLAAALAFGVVRYLGVGVVAASASSNPVLAPFAALAALLVWLGLLARVVLLVAAWVADPKVEVPLPGGQVGGAVRVGDTVRRPTGPWTPAVHELLRHLERTGLDAVPRVLGTDDRGREVLSFMPGEPVDLPAATVGHLSEAAAWLGRYHAAVADFRPGPRRWRFLERDLEVGEIVCHNDATIYNMVFEDERLTGVLDWDVAGPGTPLDDLAMLAWSALPCYAERPDEEVVERARVLAEAYRRGLAEATEGGWWRRLRRRRRAGLRPVTVRELLEHVLVRMTAATDRIAAGQAAGDPGMLNLFKAGEPARTRARLAEFRTRLPRLLALLDHP